MKIHSLRNHTLAVAAGSLMFAFGASANDDKMSWDTNKDGMISAAEHDAGIRSKWSKMDPDGDGRVNASDIDSKHQALDADKDGSITSAEFESGSRSMFSKWDTDRDGNLSTAEMQASDKPMSDQSR
jgi:Ca2+-binding EF-hand superfamily protein